MILVTGASGYIGGRLVPALLEAGHEVRVLARTPEKLRDVPWASRVEIVQGDVTDAESMLKACNGVSTLHYLVHSLNTDAFASLDRRAAMVTAEAARAAGVSRIVYLGGLHPAEKGTLSEHLESRREVGEIFLRSGVPAVVFQAAVILGSGSASFEMLRYLTERLPVMVTPKWVDTRVQPIAVRDVLHYLVGIVEVPEELNRTFDIGGPDVLTYRQMMSRYATVAGLPPRRIVPVPVLTPRLSSHWINLVTPVPKAIAAPLIESLVHEVVVDEHDVERYVPAPAGGLTGYERAVELALDKIHAGLVDTRWSDASLPGSAADPLPSDPDWAGGSTYVDERQARSGAPPEALWSVVTGIGGENGWYSFPLAWAARGWLDRLVGGVGLRRGRRHASDLRVGESLDWWRVEALEATGPIRTLRLRAEMKVPGRAWLEMCVAPARDGSGSVYRQRAIFVPHGLAGHAYWAAVSPFHGMVFAGMTKNILAAADEAAE
ncbi:MAG: SDR family oxidoreductase [Sporichthyaceae bacterium]